jgi:hypothetical protein
MNAKGKNVGGKITSIFIEVDDTFHAQLKTAVQKYNAPAKALREPVVVHPTFEAEVDELLATLKSKGSLVHFQSRTTLTSCSSARVIATT